MGSTPTQKIEADLEGTGTLVDLTAAVSAWQVSLTYPLGVVDMGAGVKHFRGRSDWTQPEQKPGALTFTVDNSSGRFTPGAGAPGSLNSWAAHARGFRPGVLVKWTCGTRVRHFRMGVPQLGFNRAAGASTTTVTCYDALGDLARQQLSSMMAEEIKARHPIVYYPLTDQKATAGLTGALDRSGLSQPPLTPYGANADAQLSWASATGPPADGASSLTLRKGGALTVLTPGLAAGLRVEPYAQPASTINYFSGPNTPIHMAWAVSFWLSYEDIYGAPSGTPGLTDGPYVGLLRFRGFYANQSASSLDLMMRTEDRRLLLRCPDGTMAKVSNDTYSLSPVDLHHVVIVFRQQQSSPYNLTVRGWVDGEPLTSNATATSANYFVPNSLPVELMPFSSPYAGPSSDLVYALSGSISHLSVHGPDDVVITSSTSTVAPTFNAAGGLSFAEAVWRAGKLALTESVTNRVARLASYSRAAAVFATAGTESDIAVGTQATSGRSLLSALSSALRADDSQLLCETVSGVERVTARLASLHRSSTPVMTIDVDADCDGEPDLTFDTSGSATRVVATGATGITAVFTDLAALDLASDQSIDSAIAGQAEVLALAQQRAAMGRVDRLTVSEVTVNATSSKATLTAGLLALQPGQTIRLTGLPMMRLTGVTSGPTGATSAVNVVVTGIEEVHTVTGSRFRLLTQPWKGEGYVGDADLRLLGDHLSTGTSYDLVLESAMTSGQTTMVVRTPNSTQISTDVADYPCYFGTVGSLPFEVIYCPNPPTAPVASAVAPGSHVQQTFSVITRGALGSTASAQTAGTRVEFIEGTTGEFLSSPYIGF